MAIGWPGDNWIEERYKHNFKSPPEKIVLLQEHFPLLDASYVEELAEKKSLPFGADELAVWPKPSRISKSYQKAVEKAFRLLGSTRTFVDINRAKYTPDNLQLVEQTRQALLLLEETTPGDYLVVPVSVGTEYLTETRRRVEDGRYAAGSFFFLGPFEVACYLLADPERLSRVNQPAIECGGVGYRDNFFAPDQWWSVLFFFGREGLLFHLNHGQIGLFNKGYSFGFLG